LDESPQLLPSMLLYLMHDHSHESSTSKHLTTCHLLLLQSIHASKSTRKLGSLSLRLARGSLGRIAGISCVNGTHIAIVRGYSSIYVRPSRPTMSEMLKCIFSYLVTFLNEPTSRNGNIPMRCKARAVRDHICSGYSR